MKRFSTAQRVLVFKTVYKNEECATQTVQKLQTIFGSNEAPCKSTERSLIQKFEATGSILRKISMWTRTKFNLRQLIMVGEALSNDAIS